MSAFRGIGLNEIHFQKKSVDRLKAAKPIHSKEKSLRHVSCCLKAKMSLKIIPVKKLWKAFEKVGLRCVREMNYKEVSDK